MESTRERIDKQLRLIIIFLKLGPIQSFLNAIDLLLKGDERGWCVLRLPSGRNVVESIRPVIDFGLGDGIPHESIALIVHNRADRAVNGEIVEIERPSKLPLAE